MVFPYIPLVNATIVDQLTPHLVGLPRELRDVIFAHAVTQDEPVKITERKIEFDFANDMLQDELMESMFTHNTIGITFPNTDRVADGTESTSIWGVHTNYKRYVRKLIVAVTEPPVHPTNSQDSRLSDTGSYNAEQKQWQQLLSFPHLSHLTVNMQKRNPKHFTWTVFTPTLIHLRNMIPTLSLTFNISFDALLKPRWDSEAEDLGGTQAWMHPYGPMGFRDVSELFERPSEEDRAYVRAHFNENSEIESRDAMRGLIYESRGDKRALAACYLVRDPALLRVRAEELYLKMEVGKNDESDERSR